MEWLYKSPGVDREQYLLGRKIDRQVDPLLASEEREKQVHSHSSLVPEPAILAVVPSGFGHWSRCSVHRTKCSKLNC